MRAVIQRVSQASVTVDQSIVGEIGVGLLVLVGVENGDTDADARYIADKVVGLRVFADEDGKMNLSVADLNAQVLIVSQFTLLGDVRKGRRPSFISAAAPEIGNELYEACAAMIREADIKVATGQFQADMKVALVNDGPVTILLDSGRSF